MDKKLNIAFLWHMHQPLYKDPFTGEYALPWTLFHGTKDYYDMAAILEEFPDIRQTINVVPCLIDQINDYAGSNVSDAYRKITLKPASGLTPEEKTFILKNFFQANWENMIRPHQRYWELLKKRGISNSAEDISQVLRYFVEQDYLDLQVLFNLVWIDPQIIRSDKTLTMLLNKGRGYAEEDKVNLAGKQTEIMGRILPKYRELASKGVIEVSTSPYYHPILPLLCDSFSAKAALPHITLPKGRFTHPEDALEQIRKGVALFKEAFGEAPRGMWPSEGSVSMDMLPLVKGEGINWLATDEEILSNTLKRPIRRDHSGNCYDPFLYKPYAVETPNGPVSMVFRDHLLSDLIGFDYARMDPFAASNDLISRLLHIYNLIEDPERHVVPIILDGENAWENYRNDGRDFLLSLYSKLSGHPKFRCTTISDFLDRTAHRERLQWIYPGSWINHNFKIWIGHHEDNTAWDCIAEARAALVRHEETLKGAIPPEKAAALKEAWEEVYASEGSDWFWWYGEEHSSMSDETFDTLFRKHIKRIYALIGVEPPLSLEVPISAEEKGFKPATIPTEYINPVIDGEVTNYFEWLAAGKLQRIFYGTAMHREIKASGIIEGIAYGFSKDTLFLRFDCISDGKPSTKEWRFSINFLHPSHVRINAGIKGLDSKASVFRKNVDDGTWSETGTAKIASERVVELGVPFEAVGAKTGDEIRFFINIDAGERGHERWPAKGSLILDLPSEGFEYENWLV